VSFTPLLKSEGSDGLKNRLTECGPLRVPPELKLAKLTGSTPEASLLALRLFDGSFPTLNFETD
jgi:hypothetical protein